AARCSLSCPFFDDTARTGFYTLSLHDALPISRPALAAPEALPPWARRCGRCAAGGNCGSRAPGPGRCTAHRWPPETCGAGRPWRSEEHTSELQSRFDLVCRLLLEKKK